MKNLTLQLESSTYEGTPGNGAESGPEGDNRPVPDSEHAPSQEPQPGRKQGAQPGNQNSLQHGAYSKDIERAKKRRLRGNAKRLAVETLAAVLRDQGSLDAIAITKQFVCQRFSRRVGWLRRMDRAVDKLIRQNPKLRDNLAGLAKLYDLTRAVENDAIADAKAIGFERAAAEGKDLNTMLDDMRREQAEEETKQ